jgi:hypothetical protein
MQCLFADELLEADDAIVVSAGKLRNAWDSLTELHSFLCEERLESSSEVCAIVFQNRAGYSVFSTGVTSHIKNR